MFHTLPADVINFGRSDNMGFPMGNLMEDGELYLVGATSGTSISRIKFTDGEINTDDTYLANCDGVAPNSGTVLNYYTDLNGDDAILYVNRSSTLKKLAFSGDGFTATDKYVTPICVHPPVGFSSVVTIPPPLPVRTLTGDYLGPIQIRQDNFPMLGDLHSFQGLRPEFFGGVLEEHCSVYHRHDFPSDHEYSCSLRYL